MSRSFVLNTIFFAGYEAPNLRYAQFQTLYVDNNIKTASYCTPLLIYSIAVHVILDSVISFDVVEVESRTQRATSCQGENRFKLM